MNGCKKGTPNSHLTCDVCKIDFNSNADFALHEFSKKHCDNLIRLAKQKAVTVKQKTKSELAKSEKQEPKINSVTHSGSFAKYGYFIPGKNYVNSEITKEFNTDYDPYLQKFAENPFKEKSVSNTQREVQNFSSVTSFKKVKKKKIKMCQVCNVTLVTLPEYEAHMKSPQHIWKLKVTGMGVSAHFVKASTDLHTTDINEETEKTSKDEKEEEDEDAKVISAVADGDDSSSMSFPLLYCSDCELLLNSPQQYNTHISGKFHSECAQRKAESKARKEKLENPPPNQLFCYSCKISLNNLNQYNEHKNGKKHKTKCKILVRRGITIPPEERFPGLPNPNPNKPVVYPELYEKFILEKEKQNPQGLNPLPQSDTNMADFSQIHSDKIPNVRTNCEIKNFGNHYDTKIQEESDNAEKIQQTEMKVSEEKNMSGIPSENYNLNTGNTENIETCNEKDDTEMTNDVSIITDNRTLICSICNENFDWQLQFDAHLSTEEHLKNILKLKLIGKSESEILSAIFSDRKVVKPNSFGKLTCSVCNITADGRSEFQQHLTTIVHKYTEKDYRKKRTAEVKNMIKCNENELYFCKLCQEGWSSLMDYTQHLHLVKHKSIQRARRSKFISERRKNHKRGLQRTKNLSGLRIKSLKNPGVRTKISGVVTDLSTGSKAQIPNLEPLEPKIDNAKNVTIGVTNQNDKNDNSNVQKTKKRVIKRQQNRGRFSFIPSASLNPSLMPCLPFPRYPRPNFIPNNGVRLPFSSPRPPFGPFCNIPPLNNPHFRPQRFLRPPWPRNRLRFPH